MENPTRRRSFLYATVAALAIALPLGTSPAAQTAEGDAAAPSLPDLPPKVRDNYEIDRLKREIELKQLQIELEQLQGPQDSELERKIKQAADLEQLLVARQRIRELLRDAPEFAPLVEQFLGIDPTPATCACLAELRAHWLGDTEEPPRATLSFGGNRHIDVVVGGSVGGTACELTAVSADAATISCGGSRRALGLYSPLDAVSR